MDRKKKQDIKDFLKPEANTSPKKEGLSLKKKAKKTEYSQQVFMESKGLDRYQELARKENPDFQLNKQTPFEKKESSQMDRKKKQDIKDFLKLEANTSPKKEGLSLKKKAKKTEYSQQVFMESKGLDRYQELARKENPDFQLNKQTPFEKKESSQKVKNIIESIKRKSQSKDVKTSSNQSKEKESKKPIQNNKEDYSKPFQAKRLQMMSNMNTYTKSSASSPLQIQLILSESLKISQDKINKLEEELQFLREKNDSLLSTADLLKEKNQELKIKIEESEKRIGVEKEEFEYEKEVLLSALASAKEQIEKLRKEKKALDLKLSNYSYNVTNRESSLEGRIEILKMENSVLQREKDKKIIELRKSVEKNKHSLEVVQKQNQDLRDLNEELQKSSHRAVSALRATIFNLEGIDKNEEILTQAGNKKDIQLKKTS